MQYVMKTTDRVERAAGLSRKAPAWALLALVGSLAACSSSASAADAGATFLASVQDFSCYRKWTSFPGVGPPGAPQPTMPDGGLHSGPLTTYVNQTPPHGSTSFPVGTIIVKEQNDPALTDRQVFAMVKRGGDYNPAGAVNWEFYELQNVDECNVSIVWSGLPLGGDPYASNPQVCNDCHIMAEDNDFVWTQGLELSSF